MWLCAHVPRGNLSSDGAATIHESVRETAGHVQAEEVGWASMVCTWRSVGSSPEWAKKDSERALVVSVRGESECTHGVGRKQAKQAAEARSAISLSRGVGVRTVGKAALRRTK